MKHVDLESFEAEFRRVRLSFGLVVDSVNMSSGPAHVGLKPLRMEPAAPGKVTVTILASDIAAFLEQQAPGGLKGFIVHANEEKLHVRAHVKLVVEMKVKAECRLEIEDGKRVNVVLESVDVLGGPAKKLVEGQMEKLNPILDTEDFPFQVNLTSITCDRDQVVGTGTVLP